MSKKCFGVVTLLDKFIKMEKKVDDECENDEHHFLYSGNEMKVNMYGFLMVGVNGVVWYGFRSIIVKSIFEVFLGYVQGRYKLCQSTSQV